MKKNELNCTCSRRSFICTSSHLVIAAGVAQYTFMNCNSSVGDQKSPVQITVDIKTPQNAPLQNVGGSIYIDDPTDAQNSSAQNKRPLILLRSAQDTVEVFSSKCPHRGGLIKVFQDGKAICEWHAAEFDTKGNVTKGPASKNLTKYPSKLDGSIVTATIQ